MIIRVKGDILDRSLEVDARVNPVNCVGVMGAGLAKRFKEEYPRNYSAYREVCREGTLEPGKLLIVEEEDCHIVNFPTKRHWKEPSRMEYITKGLDELLLVSGKMNWQTIAIPALGCGLGGLPWRDVFMEINHRFIHNDICAFVFSPQ